MALMAATDNDFTIVFWVAVTPAFISVAFVVFGVREPEPDESSSPRRFPVSRDQLKQMNGAYWTDLIVAAVLTMARFSDAFLLLRAQELGLGDTFVPMVLVVMNLVYAVSAYPLGRLADILDRRTLLALGVGILILADLVLAAAGTVLVVLIGSALWGLHMGATQGLLTAIVADASPKHLRGTAIGFYNLVTGVVLLTASTIAGVLWTGIGPEVTFLSGAGFATAALFILPYAVRRRG
jgi:MFS family permease